MLLDGMGSGSGSAANGLLSMIPGMFTSLLGGNKMDPNLVAALMNGRNNQDQFGGANGWWLWIIVLFWLWGGRGFGNGITLACSVDPIMNHLNAMKRASTDIVNSVDKNKEIIEACDSILEDINPTFKQTKDQDRKIKNLEEKVDRMGSSFDELKELLIKKLG